MSYLACNIYTKSSPESKRIDGFLNRQRLWTRLSNAHQSFISENKNVKAKFIHFLKNLDALRYKKMLSEFLRFYFWAELLRRENKVAYLVGNSDNNKIIWLACLD